MIVVVKARRMAFAGFVIFDGRTIDQKDVHPSVVVVVEGGGASALGFDDVEFFFAAAVQVEIDSGGVGDVDEEWWAVDGVFAAVDFWSADACGLTG